MCIFALQSFNPSIIDEEYFVEKCNNQLKSKIKTDCKLYNILFLHSWYTNLAYYLSKLFLDLIVAINSRKYRHGPDIVKSDRTYMGEVFFEVSAKGETS